jgi:hypothetical protein
MYGEWIECDGWKIFVSCCPCTPSEIKMSKARKYANLLNNGYTPAVEYKKL